MTISKKTTDYIYLGLIVILFAGIFFGFILISISQFLLLGIWLIEGGFADKFGRLKHDKASLIFLSAYIAFIVGSFWSSDIKGVFDELRLKLPLFSLPFLLVTKKDEFEKKHIDFLLNLFVLITFVKTLQSFLLLVINKELSLEVFSADLSHIRYSVYVLFSIFIIIYRIIKLKNNPKIYLLILLVVYFSVVLVMLQSFTAIIIFYVLILGLLVYYSFKTKKSHSKILLITIFIAILTIPPYYIYTQVKNFYTLKDPPPEQLDKKTINGNKYIHNLKSPILENGYHAGYYICEKELSKEWNKRSDIKYDSLDNTGQKIKYTLIRYLTSKGLRKDSAGVWLLTEQDIKNIENGYTNYKYTNDLNIEARIYKVIWQIHYYSQTGNANQQSISSRIEFHKVAISLLKKHLLTGVGTGDYRSEMLREFEVVKSKLQPESYNLPHNQYLSILLALGVILGSWTILAFILPFFINKKFKNFLPTVFFIIFILSMFTDDILIRASSINYIAIFYTLLILLNPKNKENDN